MTVIKRDDYKTFGGEKIKTYLLLDKDGGFTMLCAFRWRSRRCYFFDDCEAEAVKKYDGRKENFVEDSAKYFGVDLA